MVLSEKLTAKPRGSLAKRTTLYVLGFGVGSLMIAGALSFAFMSIADSVIPSKDSATASSGAPKIIGKPGAANTDAKSTGVKKTNSKVAPRRGSKARRPRANEGSAAAKKTAGKSL